VEALARPHVITVDYSGGSTIPVNKPYQSHTLRQSRDQSTITLPAGQIKLY